jgi:hypothetical protein
LQGVIERDKLRGALRRRQSDVIQRHLARRTSTLAGILSSGVVDQNVPHHLRGHGKEVGPAPPVGALLVHEPQIGFIDYGGRLESMRRALTLHATTGKTVEFQVDEREQFLQRRSVAFTPLLQQPGDGVRR